MAEFSSISQKYELLNQIGKGHFSTVYRALRIDEKRVYAIKRIAKETVKNKKEIPYYEKDIPKWFNDCNFIIKIRESFQTSRHLHLVFEFLTGGDLYTFLQVGRPQSHSSTTYFMIAEIISAVSTLHQFNCLHRDLKPENIGISGDGHIKLFDFGYCRCIYNLDCKEKEGTLEFMSPEIIQENLTGYHSDWWAVGVVFYQLIYKKYPFEGEGLTKESRKSDARRKICKLNPFANYYAKNLDYNKLAIQLCSQMLNKDWEKRIGSINGSEDLKNHEYFKDLNWEDLNMKRLSAPFILDESNPGTVEYVDKDFLKPLNSFESVKNSVILEDTESYQEFSESLAYYNYGS